MTEENTRHGDAGTPEVPRAGVPGERSAPAVPPRPSAPPTSAMPLVTPADLPAVPPAVTPAVPPADPPADLPSAAPSTPPRPLRPSVLPVSREHSRKAGPRWSDAGAVLARRAALLDGWVRRQGMPKIVAAGAGAVVLGLLVWLLSATFIGAKPSAAEGPPAPAAAASSPAPASRGTLPLEGVSPLDFQLGDCFKNFDPDAPQSTVVPCDTGHSAQLIAVHHYEGSDAYPRLNELKDKGRETCRNARLADAATNYELLQRNAYPSSSSWEKGDRRVDCYVVAKTGNVIMESLRP
ncbi:septum formation family protein [Arthrobacter sp. UYEF20]|uniref:septum formation family protein n=1 Tax=Arthrobacter sp. UYEF20 TaxID=1756363 RepID=UPI003394A9B6